MPALGLLRCHVKWQGCDQAISEHHTQYYDGGVHTYLGIPTHPTPFYIHVETTGFVATGLQAFVYMDGEYMCNRGKRHIPCPSPYLNPASTCVDLKLRQKEVPMSDGAHYGMPWQFARVNAAPKGAPVSDFVPFGGQHVGVIEVVVLRHALESSGLPRGLLTAKQTAEWQARAEQVPFNGPPRFGADGAADNVKEATDKSWFGDWTWGGDKKENAGSDAGWENHAPNSSNNGTAERNKPDPWNMSKIHTAGSEPAPSPQHGGPGPITINLTAAAGSAVHIGGGFATAPPSRKVSKETSSPTSATGWAGRKAGLSNGSEASPGTKKPTMPGAWDNPEEADENVAPNEDWYDAAGAFDNGDENASPDAFGDNYDPYNAGNDLDDREDPFGPGYTNLDTFPASIPQNDYDNFSNTADDPNNEAVDPPWNGSANGNGAFPDGEAWVSGSNNFDDKPSHKWTDDSDNRVPENGHRRSNASNARVSSVQNHRFRQQPAGDAPNDEGIYIKVKPQPRYIPLSQAQQGLFSTNPGEPPKPYWAAWKHAKDRNEEFTRPIFDAHAGEQPVYSLPVEVLEENLTTHQIQLGKPSVYRKVKFSPKYIDTMDKPFAVFTFNYRDESALSDMFGQELRESQADEANRLKALSTDEVLKIMYSRMNMANNAVPVTAPPQSSRVIPHESPVRSTSRAQPASAHTMRGAQPAPTRTRHASAGVTVLNGVGLTEALEHVVRNQGEAGYDARSRSEIKPNTKPPSSERRSVVPQDQFGEAAFHGGSGWANNDENRRPPSSKRVSIARSHRQSNAGNDPFGNNVGNPKAPSNAAFGPGPPSHRQSKSSNRPSGGGGASSKPPPNSDGGFGAPGTGSAGPGTGPAMHGDVAW